MNIQNLQNKTKSAIAWNALGALTYKAIILMHQFGLFYVLPRATYGLVGTLFATIYSVVAITHFGFDYTLFPFFAQAIKSKQAFNFVLYQFYIRVISAFVVAGIFIYSVKYFNIWITKPLTNQSISFLYLSALLIVSELIKKPLITIFNLAFFNKAAFYIECIFLGAYTTIVWSTYYAGYTLSLHIIFGTLTYITAIEIFLMLGVLYHTLYKKLPEKNSNLEKRKESHSKIIQLRIANYINQLIVFLYSPNILLLIANMYIPLYQTAVVRMVLNVMTFFYSFFTRVVAIVLGATLNQLYTYNKKTKKTFYRFYIPHIIISSFVGISLLTIVLQKSVQNLSIIIPIIITCSLEYIIMPLEKAYLTHHQAYKLAFINIATTTIAYIVFYYTGKTNTLLVYLAYSRLLCLIILAFQQNTLWSPSQDAHS